MINPTAFAKTTRSCTYPDPETLSPAPPLGKLADVSLFSRSGELARRFQASYQGVPRLVPGSEHYPFVLTHLHPHSLFPQAPQIVNLYLLDVPTPAVRAKIRQEFERSRYVQQLPVVDMLITKSDMEYQETMNYWKQIPQLMKYFRSEEDPRSQVPKDFMTGFLEVCARDEGWAGCFADGESRVATRRKRTDHGWTTWFVFTGGGLVRAVEIVICLPATTLRLRHVLSSIFFCPPNAIR